MVVVGVDEKRGRRLLLLLLLLSAATTRAFQPRDRFRHHHRPAHCLFDGAHFQFPHQQQHPLLRVQSTNDDDVVLPNVLNALLDNNDDSLLSNNYSRRTGALSMNMDELARHLGGVGRARLVWDCYAIGVDPANLFRDSTTTTTDHDYDGDNNEKYEDIIRRLPSTRRKKTLGRDALQRLAQLYPESNSGGGGGGGGRVDGGVATLAHCAVSRDGTTKLLLQLADGLQVETVIIPWDGRRSTLCISSQVGCQQGCTFCATGRMGRLRSLTSDEILAQMFFARQRQRSNNALLPPVTHVVFMGMGDPADNVEHVVRAVQVLASRDLFQLSAHKITVSTVAPTPDAFSLLSSSSSSSSSKAPCVLAWSVHAARDDLRRQLVPTTKYKMSQLRQGLMDALMNRPPSFRTTMVEVALMAGVNDGMREADELADFVKVISTNVPHCKLMVNLIPFNDIDQKGGGRYQTPSPEAVINFQRRLCAAGVYARVRTTRGDDESAACGQLATRKQREASVVGS